MTDGSGTTEGRGEDHGSGDDCEPAQGSAPDPSPDPSPDPLDQRRLLRAWGGAERRLAPVPGREPLGRRLARLAEEGASAYDLSDWTDQYGDEDGIIGELERRTAELIGTEAAAFFPTGTMAQQVALRCWAGRTGNHTVAVHPLAHPERWERDALQQLAGLRVVHPTDAPRLPTPAEVRDVAEPFGTLALELPLREAAFVLPTWDELTATVEAARERDAVVHLDGARLWECTRHFGRTLPEIASFADTVYVSFYKSLGGLSGAALAGPDSLVEEARAWRHRYGGLLFQQWPAALAALVGLERELPRLPSYVAHAAVVAEALREALAASDVPWWRVTPETPHTHQFQVWLPYEAARLTEAGARQAEETGTLLFRRWSRPAGVPRGLAMHEMTVSAPGLSWTAADVRKALAEFLALLRSTRNGTGMGGRSV